MLKVYNSLSHALEPFEPIAPPKVNLYVCGPTVYDHAHLGHARVYTAFDAIYRYLMFKGYEVNVVRNITDIDDKIIRRSQEENTTAETIAKTFTDSFHEDMKRLGLLPVHHEPKATQTIPEMITLIQTLIEKGCAYVSQGDVYFRVKTKKDYGKLSKRSPDDLMAGIRVDKSEIKEDALDFALWKAAKPQEPSWDSPFGKGRPGWHIECSAMAKRVCGETLDIHAGGRDLIFPHHENEIAQSECANEKPFSKYWLHNGFVTLSNEKMSKSVGNTVSLKQLLISYPPEALRLYLLSTHYRHPLEFSVAGVEEKTQALSRIYRALVGYNTQPNVELEEKFIVDFVEAMDQDFNTPKAVGVLFELVREINKAAQSPKEKNKKLKLQHTLTYLSGILGFAQVDPQIYFKHLLESKGVDVQAIEAQIKKRNEARELKDFASADALREELRKKNIRIEDSPTGTLWFLDEA